MSKKPKRLNQKPNKHHSGKIYQGNPNIGLNLRQAANFGTEEPFVVYVWLQTKAILEHMKLPDKEEALFRFDRVIEQLTVAKIHLSRIEDENFHNIPTFDQQAEYVAFYNSIWSAYKDRFQLFIKELGFDIGFVFQNDTEFEKGAQNFLLNHAGAGEFIEALRIDRAEWQSALGLHRNFIHTGDRRNEAHNLDNPKDARTIFDNVWHAIEDNFIQLGSRIMDDGWTIAHVPEDQRDKAVPIRYVPYIKGFVDGTIKLPKL